MASMLTERQKKILSFIVREYSRKGEPVGSKEFSQKFFPDLSSATLRREFFGLAQSGYLLQPYTSAGRIPTDKAYRFFVNEILGNEKNIEEESEHWQKKIQKVKADNKQAISQSIKMIADFCGGLGVGYLPAEGLIYKTGLKNLFAHLAGISFPEINQILEDVELIDQRIENVFEDLMANERAVFIGKESPITRSDNLSIVSRYLPLGQKRLILLVGPKKMAYEKNLSILEAIANILE